MRFWPCFFIIFAIYFPAFARPQFTKCASVLRSITKPSHDTSVELEIRNTERILELLTTTDGTLAPLLPPKPSDPKSRLILPPALEKDLGKLSYEDLAQKPWDSLTLDQKRFFLTWVTIRKTSSFWTDRNIPGIKTKEAATLMFSKDTPFLGQVLSPGNHTIDIAGLFRNVEYGSQSQNPNFLELHFRSHFPAGEVSNSAWNFLTGLNQKRPHQHVHIVYPLDISRLQKEGTVRSLMITELYRRSNLILEMMGIVEDKNHGITVNRSENVIFFDNLNTDTLNQVFRHLQETTRLGAQPPLGSQAKMAYVGFRGGDTYDTPSLIGFEVRAISEFSNPKYINEFLNTLQWTLAQEHYGISQETMQKWIDHNAKNKNIDMGLLYYNQPWSKLKSNGFGHRFEDMDPYLRKYFYDLEKSRELKMLIHDWSKDPLVFENPKLIAHIRKQQIITLNKLNEATISPQKIVEDFLIRSGIYGLFTRSLGH